MVNLISLKCSAKLAVFGVTLVGSALGIDPKLSYGTDYDRTVSLEGWLVSEVSTPSQLVGEYAICKLQGIDAALTKHRDTWVTEADFAAIADACLTHVRIPIEYSTLGGAGEPYLQGQLPYLVKAAKSAETHRLKVIVDLYGSQNGRAHEVEKPHGHTNATSTEVAIKTMLKDRENAVSIIQSQLLKNSSSIASLADTSRLDTHVYLEPRILDIELSEGQIAKTRGNSGQNVLSRIGFPHQSLERRRMKTKYLHPFRFFLLSFSNVVTSPTTAIPNLSSVIFLVASIVSAAASHFYQSLYHRGPVDKDGNSIPPGPVGLPILGSFPFLTRFPELTLNYWAKKFGPLYSIWLGEQLFVIISDPHIAKDLLITNGAIFSSRKEMFLKSKTIFLGRGVTDSPYNERWRKHRRIAYGMLNARAVEDYTGVLEHESIVLVRELYKKGKAGTAPINPQPHAGRCSLNNMTSIVFGMRTDSIDHPLVARALHLSREFMNCTGPVSNATDYIPILQKLPNYMVNRGKRLHKGLLETYGGMISEIEERMKRGEEVPDCLAKTLINVREEEKLDELDVTMLASAFMIGGVETTASIMQWFAALIPAYPEIQARAHAELDRVVGRDRLPTIDDDKDLHFIHSIIKEVERTCNPFWLGTPHVNTRDFTYRGQFIPKDTVVILNAYTIHHDPVRHPDPFTFNPDRYINDHTFAAESANLANPMERDNWMFGVGRRICPGMWLAEREVFLAVSRMLWAFKMEEEAPGKSIGLKEYDGLSSRSPVSFEVKMIPRHERVAEILGL